MVREDGEQGGSSCGAVGLGDFDFFGYAFVEYVEDVVVVLGDGLDDAECGVEVGICAFYFLWDFAGVHAAEGGEDHGDAEQCP